MIVRPSGVRSGDLVGVVASVEWEERDGPDVEVYAVSPGGVEPDEPAASHWALLAVFHAATRAGERRVRVEGPVDPVLVRGLAVAQELFAAWYGEEAIGVEAAGPGWSAPAAQGGAAQFFTGGVDSMATLVRNHAEMPPGHPHRVTTAINVDLVGPARLADLGGTVAPHHGREVARLEGWLTERDVVVRPAVTNARILDDFEFYRDWMFRAHGAHLAAVAHALSASFPRLLIASTYDLRRLAPWGSHPLLDPAYGSASLQVVHDSADLTRADKLDIVVGEPDAVERLTVCSMWFDRADAEVPNCGRCEKCLRTLAGLAAAGVDLASCGSFETVDVAAGLPLVERFHDPYEQGCWAELVAPLRRRGADGLADAVAGLVARVPLETR